jgi:DNA polymerase I-like protein with 3'-5' exonuclease and polymerase domains
VSAVVALTPYRDLAALRSVLGEATALGARFRLSGAGVIIGGLDKLPELLQDELRRAEASGLLWKYLGGEELDNPALDFLDLLGVEAVLIETKERARQAVRSLSGDAKRHGGTNGFDIETATLPGLGERPWLNINKDGTLSAEQPSAEDKNGLNPHHARIATLQLYAGGKRCYVFCGEALRLVVHSHWPRRQRLVVHNAGFETAFLQHQCNYRLPPGRRAKGRIDCTLQAQGLVNGVGFHGEGRSLAQTALDVLGLDVPKELQTSDWGAERLSPGQIAYAAADAILAWLVWPRMTPVLRALHPRHDKRLGETWCLAQAYELQRRAIVPVAAMELRGLPVDRAVHAAVGDKWARELAKERELYNGMTGRSPPANDPERREWLQWVLKDDPQRLAGWPRTPTGELSVRAGHLKRLIDIESARHVLAMRAKEQLINTFGPSLAEKISPVTGRLHGRHSIGGTKGGRFSCSGPNLQQLPRKKAPEFTEGIVATPGHLLVGSDYGQIELRGAAWLHRDQALTQVFIDGRDIHIETAARIAGVPASTITAEDPRRQKAKPVNYGALYGQSPAGLREYAFTDYGVEMSLAEAERAQAAFFNAFPQLQEGLQRNYAICRAQGFVLLGAGRIVRAEWELDTGGRLIFTRICNLPISGICADCMLRAIAYIHALLQQYEIRGGVIACVHDELLLEVHEDHAEIAKDLLEMAMIDAFTDTFPDAPVNGVAIAKIGRNWAAVK